MNRIRWTIRRGKRTINAAAPADKAECRHHWLIEPANGPAVSGVCKLCGARRQFRSSSDDYIREDGPTSGSAS